MAFRELNSQKAGAAGRQIVDSSVLLGVESPCQNPVGGQSAAATEFGRFLPNR